MRSWLRRIRAAFVMGLTWALGWAVAGGALMEGILDPHGRILDMWPQTLAIPGFVSGVVFSVVLAVAERRRRFDELSLPRFAAWGGVAGALLGALALGLGIFPGVAPLLRAAVVLVPLSTLTALSASATLALARLAEKRAQLGARDERHRLGGR